MSITHVLASISVNRPIDPVGLPQITSKTSQ